MKHLKQIILVVAVVAIGGGLWLWWEHERIHPSTDDAYLKANVLTIAPQVVGGELLAMVLAGETVNSDFVLKRVLRRRIPKDM